MVSSNAATVQEYLDELPPERRAVIEQVREVILANLPAGYQETINWGGISYEVPLEHYPKTYNKQPLAYIGLAAQKNHYALYLMCVYGDQSAEQALAEAYAQAGKKMDMGKSCLRFKKLEDLPLDVIGKVAASLDPDAYIRRYEAALQQRGKAK